MSKQARHHARQESSGLRSHRKLLVGIAAALALGWLAWNALLVESDVASVAESENAAGAPAR
ncbi:MAG: hypothetical protein ACKOCT_20845 [Alphaproteobacteria bacterium]